MADEVDPVERSVAEAARISTAEAPLGTIGSRFDRRSPFFLGMTAAAGVAVTVGAVVVVVDARPALTLVGLALFLAVGLDPVVGWLVRRRLPRWLAVTAVSVATVALAGLLLAVAIPPLAAQAGQLATGIPGYVQQLQDRSSALGKFNAQYHVQEQLASAVSGSAVLADLVSAVTLVLGAITKLVLVAVLTVFFLAGLPRIRLATYRFVPASRRPRAILLGDEILAKVGAFVLGNVIISVIAAAATFGWLVALGVPYPLLLAIGVAVLDLVPVIGSTVAGILVTVVALTVSLPVGLATAAFFLVYRFVEDYVLVPRIIGRAVHVPALSTVVAVLIGGAVLGAPGALVAIPVAASVQLLVRELLVPRLDQL